MTPFTDLISLLNTGGPLLLLLLVGAALASRKLVFGWQFEQVSRAYLAERDHRQRLERSRSVMVHRLGFVLGPVEPDTAPPTPSPIGVSAVSAGGGDGHAASFKARPHPA